MVINRSATAPTLVAALALLLPEIGSLVLEETAAVFVTVPLKLPGVL